MAPHRIHIVSGPMLVEPDVAAVRPAQLCELLLECANSRFVLAVALGVRHQDSDAPYATWLLRARGERPCRHATEQRDELTPSHSITSSASSCNALGTSMPSNRAVCALMTNSNLLDCKTGRSPGLAPLRICPVYTPTRRYASARSVP